MNKTNRIAYGDRIYARVMKNGRTILDFMTESVSNLSELITQLRNLMTDFRGMVMIHIRNYHQGWGTQRLLMV